MSRAFARRTASAPLALALLLASCGSTLSSQRMIPEEIVRADAPRGSLHVVAEGSGRRMLRGPLLDAETLAEAVRAAVRESGLYTVRGDEAPFTLHVRVVELETPEASMEMSAALTARWVLRRTGAGPDAEPLWDEEVFAEYEADFLEEAWVEQRFDAAVQGAVRENIQRGLQRLRELDAHAAAPAR